MKPRVFVPGGAGYVGAVLVPKLLEAGYAVRVLDLYLYGDSLASVANHPNLEQVKGDVRDAALVADAVRGCELAIHLACISNDPSVELDPHLSQSVNFDSFGPLVQACKAAGVRRFVFASSGSVYGVSDQPDVTEEHPLVPVSLYNKYKMMCEPVLLAEGTDSFVPVIVRPATICGYSPRQRLDLTVNILTNHAVVNKKITVFGGVQMRPNLHIDDMVDLYLLLLEAPTLRVAGQIFNAAYQNYTVAQTAEVVKRVVQKEVPELGDIAIVTTPSDDIRSYHLNSAKIERVLGFKPKRAIEDGSRDLVRALRAGKLPNSMTDPVYFNIRTMKDIHLT